MTWKSIYELLKDAGAFAGLGWLLKTGIAAFRNRLRTVDKQLLVAATASDEFIHFLNFPNLGKPWVRAGRFDLGDSPTSRAEFVESLNRLVKCGYIYQVKPNLFTLSSIGIRASKPFAGQIKLESIPSEQNSAINRDNRSSTPSVGGSVG
jgi:hypothetical protein